MDRCMYGVLSSEQREISKQLVDMAASEVGIAGHARPQPGARNRTLAVLAFLGIGVAAWAGVPSVMVRTPVPVPAQAIAAQPLRLCLEKMGAERWQDVLQNGLNFKIQPEIERSLAETGLALARLPAGLRLPQQHGSYCQWESHASAWLLWRPAYAPFALTDGARGENVRWLQTRLATAGTYTVPVDGMVGVHTFDALSAFRRQHGLSASGGADAWTLFLLEHDLGNIRQGTNNG
jgi:hypothetical protein